jgi:hypothetical protein
MDMSVDRISRWPGDEPADPDNAVEEAAAEPAEIVAVEQIAMRVLAEREDQRLAAGRARHVERQRVGAAEIGVALVEQVPVTRREEIGRLLIVAQAAMQPNDRLPVLPEIGSHRVAGGDKQRLPVAADAARRPDAAAARPRAPGDDVAGVAQADADDPAMVVAAIAGMAAIRDEHPALEDRQRAALVLVRRVERKPLGGERIGDIDRPAGQRSAVAERQGEDEMARPRGTADHRVEIDRAGRRVDRRRAGDAERVDVAAGQRRQRHRIAQLLTPDGVAGCGIDRRHHVALGCDQQQPGRKRRGPQEQGLDVEVPGKPRREAGVEMNVAGALPGQPGHGESAAAVRLAMIDEDRIVGCRRPRRRSDRRGQGERRDRAGGRDSRVAMHLLPIRCGHRLPWRRGPISGSLRG